MKKAVYRLILFAAITAFVLSLSPSVKAEPNDTQTKQNQYIASDKENLPQKLEDEKSEANVYKDDVDNLKWAIKVIAGLVTAFVGFAFASMGVILFKNKKDYEHALADAKEAAKDAKDAAQNARDLEKEAHGVLADIKKRAKTTVEEIEKTSKELKEESSKEFERQRKISELFNKGWKADEAKDYETAADCYRQIEDELKEENNPYVYHNWGNALTQLARNKKGKEAEELFKQALEKYQKAIEIKPALCEPYANCGIALIELAESKKGKEAEVLLNQAIEKCKKAVEIKPDYCSAYNEWGIALIDLAKLKGGKDAEDLLKQAEEKCLKAESLKTGVGAYNLACVYALRGNEDKCKEWLKVREKVGILPSREHAMADEDLKSVREKEWFKKLPWKGE